MSTLIGCTAHASSDGGWGYEGEAGPANWANINAEFATCSQGRNHSPINLADIVDGELPPLRVDYAPGSGITLAGHRSTLRHVNFHAPGEKQIQGSSHPMEGHYARLETWSGYADSGLWRPVAGG